MLFEKFVEIRRSQKIMVYNITSTTRCNHALTCQVYCW